MIVSRRNGTVLMSWPRPAHLCLVYIMDKFLVLKSNDSIEFIVEDNGYRIHGILGRGVHFNWIAFPELNVSCELADFNDIYWNRESLSSIFKSSNQIDIVLKAIKNIESMFDEQTIYFDGHHFISSREYIFWLESECEALSIQLTEFETYIESDEVYKWLERARLSYYEYMREQYSNDDFLD